MSKHDRRKALAVAGLASVHGFSADSPLALLIDFDHFRTQLRACAAAFAPHFKHCFAIKANPTRLVLAEAAKLGFGFEAASIGELFMAQRANPAAYVVYDSPLKSRRDIRAALQAGAALNIDNLQELEGLVFPAHCCPSAIAHTQHTKTHAPEVVAEEVERLGGREKLKAAIGIRVNPQVGSGSLAGFSTATLTSKFGIGLRDDGGKPLLDAYKRFPFLTGIMCHVGSQGIPFDLAVVGIKATAEFAVQINRCVGYRQVDVMDIGGGMSVNFASDDVSPTFEHYAAALRQAVPTLFDPNVFSMFGRALVAKSGFFASRVEYVKTTGGRRIAIQYAGADTFVRTVYHPKEWPLRITVLSGSDFSIINSNSGGNDIVKMIETDVAGPCCIQADIVAHQRLLPDVLKRGDALLFHDTGGYYHSGHTRYNLRQASAVWSFENNSNSKSDEDKFEYTLLQAAETIDETLDAFCEPAFKQERRRHSKL